MSALYASKGIFATYASKGIYAKHAVHGMWTYPGSWFDEISLAVHCSRVRLHSSRPSRFAAADHRVARDQLIHGASRAGAALRYRSRSCNEVGRSVQCRTLAAS